MSQDELTESIEVAPEVDVASWRLSVPGRGACYLLEDASARPVLLATVGNCRAALERRLSASEQPDGPSKRIDYRAVVRRVRWRAVFSRFEANWIYLENARRLFPRRYRRMIRQWRAWWIVIDPTEAHPRFVRAERPAPLPASSYGPLPTAKSAARLIELLEDLFDLCRYHHILVQAPHGTACSYKQMGRCPAPCDGTVTMDHYRAQLAAAMAFITEPRQAWIADVERQMHDAAAALQFERANRFKRRLEKAAAADAEAMACVAPLDRFAFIVLQRGARRRNVRAFAVEPGRIDLIDEFTPKQREAMHETLLDRAAALAGAPITALNDAAADRIALASWHLLGGRREPGAFLRADAIDAPMLDAATERLAAPRAQRDSESSLESMSSE